MGSYPNGWIIEAPQIMCQSSHISITMKGNMVHTTEGYNPNGVISTIKG